MMRAISIAAVSVSALALTACMPSVSYNGFTSDMAGGAPLKAVAALDRILPTQKEARVQAVARLAQVLTRAQLDSLVAALFKGY